MKIDLTGKVALITGAAGDGLGRADALVLGQAGCKVALMDVVNSDETVSYLKKNDIDAKGYVCDISDAQAVNKAVENIVADFGTIHIVINNASIVSTVGFFASIPVDKFNRDIQVNIVGSANVTRAAWPYMLKNGWGRVIFMSSVAGTRGGSGQTSYSTTKAAVIGLSKSLALEGARKGITSNVVAPGVIETACTKDFIRGDMMDRMKKAIPMRRLGQPEDIANMITFLCSEQASYVTGQVYEVDGGSGLFVF